MNHFVKLSFTTTNLLTHLSSYRSLIERLIYLTTTPDIAQVVHYLSQFVYAPTIAHQQVALCILRYLKHELGKNSFLSTDKCYNSVIFNGKASLKLA